MSGQTKYKRTAIDEPVTGDCSEGSAELCNKNSETFINEEIFFRSGNFPFLVDILKDV